MNDIQENPASQTSCPNNRHVKIGVHTNSDLVEYELNAKPWETMSRPLNGTSFSHRTTFLITPGIILYKETLSSAIHASGLTPPGMFGLLIPLQLGRKSRFWNKPPVKHRLTASMPGEFDAVIDADQAHIIVLIDVCLLERQLSVTQLQALRHAAANHQLPASESAIWNLRQWLEYLLDRSQREPGYFQHPVVIQVLEEELVRLLTSTIDLACYEQAKPALSKRRNGYERALEYLRDNNYANLNIAKICQEAGISQRTLEYAFRERLNTTPHNFIKQLCLHSIRKSLSTSHADETTVTDIVFKHGVYDMGRFASVYKKHFGELPSQTLRKPPIRTSSPYLRL